ncbi:MAG: hypothetical protein K0S46_1080 [Moraxellaceae bacterium]|jgi:hypothetical protein|nr:hypothetical protein [Moraxellaceae bacterium]
MKGAIDTGKLRPNQGRTNQKLYFARLQLDRVHELLAEKSAFAWEAEALSCREAAVLHLHGAYLAFLQELVRFYKLQGPLMTSEALRVAMAAKGQVSPEITVLQQLEQRHDAWLAQLLRAHQDCLIAPDVVPAFAAEEADAAAGARSISVTNVASDEALSAADLQAIRSWHQELTGIIRDFRREMAEW